MTTLDLLALLATPSPSGWEREGQLIWMSHAAKVSDRVEHDDYGNAWAVVDGTQPEAPRVMLGAHADEIGFIVRYVDEKGFLSIGPIGGSDRTLSPARRVVLFGSKGPVTGVIGNTAIHLRERDKDKPPEWKELFVDIGASTAAGAAERGIRVGTPAIFEESAVAFEGNRIMGRALDNRIGGYVLALILAAIHADRPIATTVALNAVQEELGSHGALMATHRIRPNAAIIFDVTHATDTPGIDPKQHGFIGLGKGPVLSHGAANHPLIVQRLLDVAARESIAVQHEGISRTTSTDADVVFTSRDGIPTALISIPLRYMHSPVEIVSLDDVQAVAQLTTAFIRSLDERSRFGVLGDGFFL